PLDLIDRTAGSSLAKNWHRNCVMKVILMRNGKAMNFESSSILIVDDEELNSEGLARRLQRYGYAVTVAKSGREAIELLGQRHFDLVLLDIMMPGMNGLEVLKLLRRLASRIDLPIIMAHPQGDVRDQAE